MTIRDPRTGKEKITIYDFKPTTIEYFYDCFNIVNRSDCYDRGSNKRDIQRFIDRICRQFNITLENVHDFEIID